jgi:protein SCO1/2
VIPGGSIRAGLALLIAAALVFGSEAPVLGQASGYGVTPAKRSQVNLPIPDFSLKDQSGGPFSFQSLRGKLVLVTFIYATCPYVCPLLTLSLRRVQRDLRANEHASVFLLGISIDPEIDTPKVLKSYGDRYQVDYSNWSFLTGDIRQLAPVWKAFGVQVERRARGLVDHTSLTALVDKKGVMRFAYHGMSADPKMILQDLRALLISN